MTKSLEINAMIESHDDARTLTFLISNSIRPNTSIDIQYLFQFHLTISIK